MTSLLVDSSSQNAQGWALRRLNIDGTPDDGFMQANFTPPSGAFAVTLQPDGKILVSGGFDHFNGAWRHGVVRLNANGSLDDSFARFDRTVEGLFLRPDGKVIVSTHARNGVPQFLQLNTDGTIDPAFSPPEGFVWPHRWLEKPDGRLLVNIGQDSLIRLNQDLFRDTNFMVRFPYSRCDQGIGTPNWLALTQSGEILFSGAFGFVRLLDVLPRPDFRQHTRAEFSHSDGVARIYVVRTGDTVASASVDFTTKDGTAKAGEDYLPQKGTLNFAPLEISKTVLVPLSVFPNA